MGRVSFHTLGCKLNYAETSSITRQFVDRSYEVIHFGEPADVTVINTCTVTEQAEQKCRNAIRRALRANPDAFVVVTGCYAQLRPEQIAGIPGVDVVLGAGEKFRLFNLVEEFTKREQTQISVSCIDEAVEFGPAYSTGERTRAFLKIQDGCDYTCSFCTIPMARGRSRSQSIEATVRQAREIAGAGYREIVLSGVNIGLFGQERGTNLLALLNELDAVDGIERFRISSIEPNLLTDEIIGFVSGSERFQRHFHIPLQSGDDYVLGKMRRRYRREDYADRVEKIKLLMPDACIGADVIVGFPAENEARFDNTYRFLSDLPVSYLHVFTYSERPGTVAVEQLDGIGTAVPGPERKRRSKMLRILSEKKKAAFYREHAGTVRPVLWEDSVTDGRRHGFTDNYIKAGAPSDASVPNTIEQVLLGDLSEDGTIHAEDPSFLAVV